MKTDIEDKITTGIIVVAIIWFMWIVIPPPSIFCYEADNITVTGQPQIDELQEELDQTTKELEAIRKMKEAVCDCSGLAAWTGFFGVVIGALVIHLMHLLFEARKPKKDQP